MGYGHRTHEDQGYAVKVGRSLYVKNRAEWRRWLRSNHKAAAEIWLIYYKKNSGKPRIPSASAGLTPPAGGGRHLNSACAISSR